MTPDRCRRRREVPDAVQSHDRLVRAGARASGGVDGAEADTPGTANGITVLAKTNHTSPTVSILVGVRTGAYADPPEKDGTAALCARVLDRGTSKRTAEAIADDLDGRGASLSVIAGRHQMALAATCLADDFEPVLTLVADVARHPGFPDNEIATRREALITSIRQEEDNPATMAGDAFAKALYGDHPYARKVRGTIHGLESIRRQDLVRFHQKGFDPPMLTVVVVGDLVEEYALAVITKLFGDWSPSGKAAGDKTSASAQASTSAKASTSVKATADKSANTPAGQDAVIKVPDLAAPQERRLVTVPMMNKSQADVVYGFVGVKRSDPDYHAISVMNNALGQYAIGGRLGDSIRERQGMAYYVFSSLDATFGPGPFTIRAGVSASNVEKTISSIDQELNLVLTNGFTAQEVDESKSFMIGSMPRQLETNAAIASFLLNVETFGLGLDYDERLPGLIGAVTKDAVDAAARRLLDPLKATIGVAGPWTPAPISTAPHAIPATVADPPATASPPPPAVVAPSPVPPPVTELPSRAAPPSIDDLLASFGPESPSSRIAPPSTTPSPTDLSKTRPVDSGDQTPDPPKPDPPPLGNAPSSSGDRLLIA